jgi:hypothetical protein
VKLGDLDCGCDDRKYIMFQAGRMGLTEGLILTAAIAAILVARRMSK